MIIKFYSIIIIILMITGCSVRPSPAPTYKPLSTFPSKQPEPQRPIIEGRISGLPNNTLLTIHVKTLIGKEAIYLTQAVNSHWEIVITSASGVDYIITAEAAGYTSTPQNYTIHLSDTTVYIVDEGQITENEAINLDFLFTPSNLPSN
jgi:hypothetical protein